MKSRRVTINDIARELNTTASTVSRALQDHPSIGKEMKKAVIELTRKLNYKPNYIAASLRRGKGNTIAVIVPGVDRWFFSSVIRGIEDVAYEKGYNVLICQSHDSYEREKKVVQELLNGIVDGIIASLALETEQYPHYELVRKKGLPLVFFDRVAETIDTHKIILNDFAGAFDAVEHMIKQGCRNIVHFAGAQHISIYRNRFEGYKAALLKYGLNFNNKFVFSNTLTREKGKEAATEMLNMNPLPDGILAASDFSALGAIFEIKNAGLNIPKDIAIVGFANEPFDDMLDPGISSVDQHSLEMGQKAASLLFDAINNNIASDDPKIITLNPDLIIRNSSLRS